MGAPFDFGDAGASSSVPATIVRAIALAIRERGHDPSPLLARLGIDETSLSNSRSRVSAAATAALWNEAPSLVGDEHFGLSVAQSRSDALSLAGYLFRSSATFGEGLLKLGAYYRVFNDVHPLDVHQEGEAVRILVRTKSSPIVPPRHAVEFAFAWLVTVARQITEVDLAPLAVAFEHAAPADVDPHTKLFRCEVSFAAEASELRFPMTWLMLPHPTYDPHLRELLEHEARTELEMLPPQSPEAVPRGRHASRVREIVRPLLRGAHDADGEPTLDVVAARMRMSARSLQRYLRDEGTTFQRELDELRCSAAIELIREGRASLAEVAHELGFADQSAFHKAFVRWTGKTPGEFRRG